MSVGVIGRADPFSAGREIFVLPPRHLLRAVGDRAVVLRDPYSPQDGDRGNLAQPRWRVVGVGSLEQVKSVSAHLHGQLGALVLALGKPIRVGSGAIPLHPFGINVSGQPVRGCCRQRLQSCSQRFCEEL
jgi:hypothetical protein